jgi:DNA repair photolyase
VNRNYHTPIGLTSQFSFCGLPLRLDSYAGCALSCTYCFARLRGGNADTNKIRFANPTTVISKFKNAIDKPDLTTGVVAELIRNRTPVHFGGMSDPFQPIEAKERITYKILQFLGSLQYPTVISTKSTLPATNEYLSVLRENKNLIIQFSFSTTNDELSSIVEPTSYRPTEILKAMNTLTKNGINTTVRWQPFIPTISETPNEFVTRVANVGAKHIGFEHLKLPLERNNPLWMKLSSKLHFDVREYYKSHGATIEGREWVLPPEYKIGRALEVKSEAAMHGLTFGSADNEIQYLSDNYCCCSGVDRFKGFENWNKFQIAYAIKKSHGNPITIDLIENEWRPKGSVDKYLNSQSRMDTGTGFSKVQDYIYERWENLNSPFNPSKFYGVVDSGVRDDKGFRIFNWSK